MQLLQLKTCLRVMLPAKAVDVEVESKVEQLEVVGNSSENLRTGREYILKS